MARVTIDPQWAFWVREARGSIALEKFAERVGIAEKTLRRIENARSPIRLQERVWLPLLEGTHLRSKWDASIRAAAKLPAKQPPPPQHDVFIASAMDSLGDEYSAYRATPLGIVDEIKQMGLSVYCAAVGRSSRSDFEDEGNALTEVCALLRGAKCLVLLYPPPLRTHCGGRTKDHGRPLASSVLVEVGYGIALGLPTLALYHEARSTLPFLIQSPENVLPGWKLIRYRNAEEINELVRNSRSWFPEPAAPPAPDTPSRNRREQP